MNNDKNFDDLLDAFNLDKGIDEDNDDFYDDDEDDDDDYNDNDLFDFGGSGDNVFTRAGMVGVLFDMMAERIADETSDRIAELLGLDDTGEAYDVPEKWYKYALDFIEDKGLLREFRSYCEEVSEDE